MPKLPATTTLQKLDAILEAESARRPARQYMGMSQIGDECWRKLFYSFRHAAKRSISASGIRAIEDGFTQEDIMALRLRKIPGVELITHPNGSQIEFKGHDGHFSGHADGMVRGLEESPENWHVWEHKSVNEAKFKTLAKLKEAGEKKALEAWDPVYYAQALCYMHYSEVHKHFLTVSTPGGRDYMSIRTDYKKGAAKNVIDKAKQIIFDNWIAPVGLSDKKEFYKCKWCEYSGICHDGDIPDLNCHTCRYRDPVEGGKFYCLDHNSDIVRPCNNHIYNPALIDAEIVDQYDDGTVYKSNDLTWANIRPAGLPEDISVDIFYSSAELFKLGNLNNISAEFETVKSAFKGEIDPTAPEWEKTFKGI